MRRNSSTKNTKLHEGEAKPRYQRLRAPSRSLWILCFFLLVAPAAPAQSPTPTPVADNVANADALTNLVIVAG